MLNMFKKNISLLRTLSFSKQRIDNEAKNESRNYQIHGRQVRIELIKIKNSNPRSNLKKFKKWRK